MFRKPTPSRASGGQDYWVSYSDLMAGLLLMFILLLVGVLIVSKRIHEAAERELEERERLLKEAEAELGGLRQRLGIPAEIIQELQAEFKEKGDYVRVDDATGAIGLGSDVLFAEGSSNLTRQGRTTLDEIMPGYFRVLLGNPRFREHVDQVIFEGHTNTNFRAGLTEDEGYLLNLKLSQERAYAAMEFVIANGIGAEYVVKPRLAAIGYSSSRIRQDPDGSEDKEASRRLEIRFRLKDEDSLEQIRTLLEKEGR